MNDNSKYLLIFLGGDLETDKSTVDLETLFFIKFESSKLLSYQVHIFQTHSNLKKLFHL